MSLSQHHFIQKIIYNMSFIINLSFSIDINYHNFCYFFFIYTQTIYKIFLRQFPKWKTHSFSNL